MYTLLRNLIVSFWDDEHPFKESYYLFWDDIHPFKESYHLFWDNVHPF